MAQTTLWQRHDFTLGLPTLRAFAATHYVPWQQLQRQVMRTSSSAIPSSPLPPTHLHALFKYRTTLPLLPAFLPLLTPSPSVPNSVMSAPQPLPDVLSCFYPGANNSASVWPPLFLPLTGAFYDDHTFNSASSRSNGTFAHVMYYRTATAASRQPRCIHNFIVRGLWIWKQRLRNLRSSRPCCYRLLGKRGSSMYVLHVKKTINHIRHVFIPWTLTVSHYAQLYVFGSLFK